MDARSHGGRTTHGGDLTTQQYPGCAPDRESDA